ncbi:hypothetical protein J5N97_027716 [Dioscorea zingiberensis]|uniref:Uncharacterized protein n=1 Tax=Dioscorea zingiberensis TaxID=325984 RepID=A0A9D5BXQ7_9LILI|nr:hypothetical protein J5N97_027716 [Dioscorea zingiberensis]
MASSPIHALKVLEQSSVSPPNSSVPETSIPLSFCDLMWLNLNHVERIFFYSIPTISTSHFIKHLLPPLKTSLSLTLQHFFPLAGHVIFSPDSDSKFHYHYNDGDSISFTVAESDRDFTHLAGDDARSVIELESLVPALAAVSADATPLMAVLVTVFPSQGVCLGLTINHGACDGSSAANFLKSWAATCKSGAASAVLSTTPLFDRSLFVYPKELHAPSLEFAMKSRELHSVTPSIHTTDHDLAKTDMVIASFWLTRDQIEKLKRWISEEKKVGVHCSTFVVACAYVWTCQVRARGSPTNQVAWLGFPVNARGRLRPPVPEGYFGNCLGVCLSNVEVGELVKEDGLRVAAEVLGREVDGLGDGVLGDVDAWVEMGKVFKDERPLSVSGSPGFRVYDSDFGWGRPVKVEVVSLRNTTGAMSISEGKDGGGIGIGLAAPKMEMERFSFEFAQGLDQLLHSC